MNRDKNGKWVSLVNPDSKTYKCSLCGYEECSLYFLPPGKCPFCNAKMKIEGQEEIELSNNFYIRTSDRCFTPVENVSEPSIPIKWLENFDNAHDNCLPISSAIKYWKECEDWERGTHL